jgi:hypothetical protein
MARWHGRIEVSAAKELKHESSAVHVFVYRYRRIERDGGRGSVEFVVN